MTHSTSASHLIVPPTGALGDTWPSGANFPQGMHGSISMADWTMGNDGYVQQTFLGASIKNFTMKGGFGDSTSDLGLSLIVDEYNASDTTGFGQGDDAYHNGAFDKFSPPPVGTPVFFKFGRNHSTVPQAWIREMDILHYGAPTTCSGIPSISMSSVSPIVEIPSGGLAGSASHETLLSGVPVAASGTAQWVQYQNVHGAAGLTNLCRGYNHLTFGGILQSYTQNRGPSANPEYSVTVKDPREILSNVVLVLNNYAGTTYNNKNIYNIYGFLQHDLTDGLKDTFEINYAGNKPLTRSVDRNSGKTTYTGTDMWVSGSPPSSGSFGLPETFPMTGEGFARRSDPGIPWYRVRDGLNALFQIETLKRLKDLGVPVTGAGDFPEEFIEAGYGGFVDFRGFKYVVDFSGIPLDKIPNTYYLDFDQMDLLSLAQELCEVISHDFFVQLLPVIDHPLTKFWYDYNNEIIGLNNPIVNRQLIAGVIRVDAIDRSKQPTYGSVKRYIDQLPPEMSVTNEDIGFELSNVVTDKFIVGAQESELYFFNTNRDRDILEVRKEKDGVTNHHDYLSALQWYHETSLQQQILPFYGFLGKNAVTIPRGWGSYQQIQLDTTALNAHGVGNYYIATELELRAAAVSYERWKQFLIPYNDVYLQSTDETDVVKLQFMKAVTLPTGSVRKLQRPSDSYAVTVPRCVFDSDIPEVDSEGLPLSPCSPPYGYPLYYNRAERIGIPEAGVVKIQAALTKLVTNYAGINEPGAKEAYRRKTKKHIEAMMAIAIAKIQEMNNGLNAADRELLKKKYKEMEARILKLEGEFTGKINQVEQYVSANEELLKTVQRLGKQSIDNSYKVYNFLKSVADNNLGKKFLVKIPKYVNNKYQEKMKFKDQQQGLGVDQRVAEFEGNPFGFDYRPINSDVNFRSSIAASGFLLQKQPILDALAVNDSHAHYLTSTYTYSNEPWSYPGTREDHYNKGLTSDGALKTNYNPMSTAWEFNYAPDPKGGFLPSGQYLDVITPKDMSMMPMSTSGLPLCVQQKLFPTDPTNFVSEQGRMLAYVRYDNSQHLTFKGVSKNKFVQEAIEGVNLRGVPLPFTTFVPDITEELDNTHDDQFHAFQLMPGAAPATGSEKKPKSVGFVACSLDENLYMPAKVEYKDLKVYGRGVIDSGTSVPPKIIWDPETCSHKESYGYYFPHWVPDASGGYDTTTAEIWDYPRENRTPSGTLPTGSGGVASGVWSRLTSSGIIPTQTEKLDPENVYALITTPGKIMPTIDSRFQDGPYQHYQAALIKNYLLMDTVDDRVKGFQVPGIVRNQNKLSEVAPELSGLCANANFKSVFNAFWSYKASLKALSFATPEVLNYSVPSPVYPNLVVLPLMSMERCYGPWVSSEITAQGSTYKNIGGRVEFIKEETIAPWNYGGYTLMNEAGALQAKFSNSLLLFSERGGFTIPDTPSGVSLCQALIDGGPLVTSISVSVTESEIKSTYQMDLYTSSFGKLDRQKGIALSQIVREKQKLKDEKNSLIRKGMGKSRSNKNFTAQNNKFDELISLSNSTDEFSPLESNHTVQEYLIITNNKNTTEEHDAHGNPHEVKTYGSTAGMQSRAMLSQNAGNFPTEAQAAKEMSKSVIEPIGANVAAVDRGGGNPYMTNEYRADHNVGAFVDKFYNDNDPSIPGNIV